MISIAKNIVFQRWDNLPQNLRDVLCLEENAIVLQKVAQDEHLPPQKFKDFSRIAGYVILGFVHPEDLARNLEESLHLPPQTAKNIQAALLNNIFNAHREDLDKIYNPLSEKDFGLQSDRRQPNRATMPMPSISSQSAPVILKVGGGVELPRGAPQTQSLNPPTPPTPPGASKAPPTAPPSPMVFGARHESRPINTPQGFRLGRSVPTPKGIPTPPPSPPSRPARVELGKMEVKKEDKLVSSTKEVGREPIKFSGPKDMFMPWEGKASTPKPSVPPPAPSAAPIPNPQNKAAAPPTPPPASRKEG